MANDKDYCKLLVRYPKAIAHLRWQVEKKRFGLVVGAGISKNFNVPMWETLVTDIASSPSVDGEKLIEGESAKNSLPYKTEMLFQRFQEKHSATNAGLSSLAEKNTVMAAWHRLCQEYIYRKPAPNLNSALRTHPYFESLILLVQDSYLTINFNFDDFLERSLALRKQAKDVGTRGFEVVTDPWPQFRRTDSVIYHPHGYVPSGIMEKTVDRFVFSEGSYSSQYVGARGHDTSFLVAHFARNTCLLVGCSLEDELRNVLMRGAEINPGNYHYYIHFVSDTASPPNEIERRLIEDTNFKVYNLITIFLKTKEIDTLLRVINQKCLPDPALNDLSLQCKAPAKFTYYMTGPLGVGKSTTTNLLRSLHVLDEWQEARLQVLSKPWDSLTKREEVKADNWIAQQFKKKNDALRHLKGSAISVVDRPPLDPLVFTKREDRPAKAKALIDAICPERRYDVERGVVLLLLGNPDVLSARVCATGRERYTPEKLKIMQDDMLEIYKDTPGVVVIDTTYLSVAELTKRVAQVIHREEYAPADLMGILKSHEEKADAAA